MVSFEKIFKTVAQKFVIQSRYKVFVFLFWYVTWIKIVFHLICLFMKLLCQFYLSLRPLYYVI